MRNHFFKIFIAVSLVLSNLVSKSQQITDSASLRAQVNADIVTNGTRAITAVKLNRLLQGNINLIPRYAADSFRISNDSVFYRKDKEWRFGFTVGGGSVETASNGLNKTGDDIRLGGPLTVTPINLINSAGNPTGSLSIQQGVTTANVGTFTIENGGSRLHSSNAAGTFQAGHYSLAKSQTVLGKANRTFSSGIYTFLNNVKYQYVNLDSNKAELKADTIFLNDSSSVINGRWGFGSSPNTVNFGVTATFRNDLTLNNGLFRVGLGLNQIATNSVLGVSGLSVNTTGANNTALGYEAMKQNTTASNNTVVGSSAFTTNLTSSNNTAVGYNALNAHQSGAGQNVAVGANALKNNLTGPTNVAVGYNALLFSNATSNTAVGFEALHNNTSGTSNAAFGKWALDANTTGLGNTAIGTVALTYSTTASENTAVGHGAGRSQTNPTASHMTMVGYQAGYTGSTNSTMVGHFAGFQTGGSNNNFFGANAGFYILGSNNTILGPYTGGPNPDASNRIYIADGAGTLRYEADSLGNFWSRGTGGYVPPSGTTAQRPSHEGGRIRWNSTTSKLEFSDGSNWNDIGTGGGGGVTTVGAINGVSKHANGAVISGTTIHMQEVDTNFPGLMPSDLFDSLSKPFYVNPVLGPADFYPLARQRNDSVLDIKSFKLSLNGVAIAPTPTDTSVHFNIPNIYSGSYLPTFPGGNTNVAASTAFTCYYMRVDNVVHVFGTVSIDPTAAGPTVLTMSVPIPSGMTGIEEDGAGHASSPAIPGEIVGIYTTGGADVVQFKWTAVSTANNKFSFHLSYWITAA